MLDCGFGFPRPSYAHVYISLSLYIYIDYIYICVCICVYIHIYTCTQYIHTTSWKGLVAKNIVVNLRTDLANDLMEDGCPETLGPDAIIHSFWLYMRILCQCLHIHSNYDVYGSP